ncbi:glycoside hydrolase family 3 domain protein [Gemmatirosa kalamazoonensis]|uniref:beta-glucosidase n=1 Tax=Gemmatirosa kalamazoonensis TaxID=861299 RepID=W0REK3_9BACT|nr:glycoside hydrolase family 3 N-terminal domain-containing protein [Gemmatirosa kalamazoonensis]AHG89211.1 glycoside hydrolase family 3 domain protein [Gemmatirosa kalamazoonensis]
MPRIKTFLALACLTTTLGAQPTDRASRIADSVLKLMTLDEKIGQLVQAPGQWNQTGPAAPAGGEQGIREGKIGSFLSLWGAAETRKLQRIAVNESRLHVPLLFAMDVIHGWRTIFPVPLGEAATWDPTAVERSARVAAVEASAFGIHWTFAPMVDIARDARWGRIVEGSGEDPFLGSVMAAARVRGFQNGPPNTTLLATVKHFAAYGAAEGGRDYDTAELSERTLWETYLPPYEAAVRAGAATIMSSFNDIGGTPAHASRWLLSEVLRGQWGFRGLVVSDWAGIEQLMPHGVAATKAEAATRAMNAGVDVDMSDYVYQTDLAAAVRAGTVPMAAVDSAAHRVLRAKAAFGLFADPYKHSDTTRERTAILTAENRRAAREVGREAIVLLKNDRDALPLAKRGTVAVIGPLADDRNAPLGSWNGAGRAEDVVTPLAAIREVVGASRVTYVRGVPVDTPNTDGITAAVRAARAADAVVLVLGERADMTGEASVRSSIELPGEQLLLAKAVVRAARGTRKPVVAVLMNGRPLAVPWLADSVPALVESWFLGVEHGHALADVLFGDYNPAGRLPSTFPRATGQLPMYYDHKNTGRPPEESNHYTSKYLDIPWTPQFVFGHGLSYTTFRYSVPRLSATSVRAGDSVVVEVDVTNTGRRAGDEVAQLYLRDDVATTARPVRELRGFRRLTIQPGETRHLRFVLNREAMAMLDVDLRRVVEPGTFTVWVGGSSAATNEARFTLTGDVVFLAPAPPRYH